MPFVDELQELEAVPAGYPFISLYLDVGHNEESAEEIRVFTRNRLRQALADTAGGRERHRLETDARHITAYLEDVIHARINRQSAGLGIFACAGQKYFQVVSSPEPFPSQMHIGDRPHLQPLRDRANGQKRLFAVHLDQHEQRIIELGVGAYQDRHGTHRKVSKHDRGGWSHLQYRRPIAAGARNEVAELRRVLIRLADETPGARIVLTGQEAAGGALRDSLPTRLAVRLLDALPGGLPAGEHQALSVALENARCMAPHDLDAQMEPELEAAMSPRRGARGLDEVLRAANAHSIRCLFVPEGFDARGWRCTSCASLGSFVRLQCNYCGGNVSSIDLRPELEGKVLSSGGTVYIVPRDRNIARRVLASLRYA
jgi:peptide subunit release factor 1 (eRF1)